MYVQEAWKGFVVEVDGDQGKMVGKNGCTNDLSPEEDGEDVRGV
jgi:hypothetical protein